MSERFFVSTRIETENVQLNPAESRHLGKVMRARLGDQVALFDGSGYEFAAEIVGIEKNRVDLRVVRRTAQDREPSRELSIAVALPKGERQRWLVEKCTELGVAEIVPLVTRRSVAKPVPHALDRLRRAVIEASKQCGRNRLLKIGEPRLWDEFVTDERLPEARWIADPAGEKWDVDRARSAEKLMFAVGPEGGLSEEEVRSAHDHGWRTVELGTRILRVETAAIQLASMATILELIS